MTNPNSSSINLVLAITSHVQGEIDGKRAEIRTLEKKLESARQDLHQLLAIREAAGVPDPEEVTTDVPDAPVALVRGVSMVA